MACSRPKHAIERELSAARPRRLRHRGERWSDTRRERRTSRRDRGPGTEVVRDERVGNLVDGELRDDEIARAIAGKRDRRAAVATVDARGLAG